jgi:hypothetical protein
MSHLPIAERSAEDASEGGKQRLESAGSSKDWRSCANLIALAIICVVVCLIALSFEVLPVEPILGIE